MRVLRSKPVLVAMTAAIWMLLAAPTGAWAQNHHEAFHPEGQSHPSQNQSHPQGVGHPKEGHSGQWLREHRNLTPEQQRKALESDPQFRNLPPWRQQQLRRSLQRFNGMPPEQQERTLSRMETWEHLTPEQKQQARELHFQMRQLPLDRRQAIRNAVQSLRAMPPEARQRAIESDAYKSRFTPQEREMLNNASRLPLAPAEPNETPPEP
ncbi:MAG TPA: DUF3106 domain-containing protein [Terriglobales bacterium]|nr:DUF3106 domain-containing protein [Terriglobales bacterium]